MDKETRYALASLYEKLKTITEQASAARIEALVLRLAISEVSPEIVQSFRDFEQNHQVIDMRLAAAQKQVEIDAVIRRLTDEDLT
jgi:uncharacterized coiled-coil protein SlyX